uniref:Uncharacterized protein n=1 Tax=Anopheles farauti TaxID=69004 RepID=A0A182QFR1_9DIPT
MKQPMSKTQRLKNIFAKRMQRAGGAGVNELPEESNTPDVAAVVAVVDEQDGKPADATKSGKDDQTLVYAELELKPAGGEISFVNKPTAAANESTEYAEILYVQQQAGTTGSETTSQQPPQRHHSSEDNRPVIDVSIQKPSAKSADGSKASSGGK